MADNTPSDVPPICNKDDDVTISPSAALNSDTPNTYNGCESTSANAEEATSFEITKQTETKTVAEISENIKMPEATSDTDKSSELTADTKTVAEISENIKMPEATSDADKSSELTADTKTVAEISENIKMPEATSDADKSSELTSDKSTPVSKKLCVPLVRYQPGWSKLSREDLIDKIKGCLYGNALGDAMGLATEFLNKEQVKAHYKKPGPIKFEDFIFDMHRSRWVCGDWTDDTDQMILIMECIIESGGNVIASDFAAKLRKWRDEGFTELGDTGGLGVGYTVNSTITHSCFLSDPHKAALEVWTSSGKYLAANGAVMRTSCLGLVNFNDLDAVIKNTKEISLATHADPRCTASCVAVTTLLAQILQGNLNPSDDKQLSSMIDNSIKIGISFLEDDKLISEFKEHLSANKFKDLKLDDGKTIGYTLKCAGCSFVGLRKKATCGNDFIKILTELVREAGDADTNGAVCGAMLGCKLGYKNLPLEWIQQMPHKEWFDKKIDQFLACVGLLAENLQ